MLYVRLQYFNLYIYDNTFINKINNRELQLLLLIRARNYIKCAANKKLTFFGRHSKKRYN